MLNHFGFGEVCPLKQASSQKSWSGRMRVLWESGTEEQRGPRAWRLWGAVSTLARLGHGRGWGRGSDERGRWGAATPGCLPELMAASLQMGRTEGDR